MLDAEVFLSKGDFRTQAKTLQGSRDFGAQLFCALLRGVAIETRLVCSLQPLPFSGTVKDMTPSKPKPQYIVISSDDPGSSTDERLKTEKSPTASRSRRIGQPKFAPSRRPQPPMRLGMCLADRHCILYEVNIHRHSSTIPRLIIPGILGGSF
jgi:xeroderma pigmentosum group C-complementing protein